MDTGLDKRERLIKLLKDFDTAMLVTQSAGLGMHARPMSIAEMNDAGDMFLVTRVDTPKVDEIFADETATLTFQADNKFATLNGRATLDRDQAQIERLWKEAWKIWFPEGKSDPSIRLIRFATDHGEYWDNAGVNGIKYMFRAVTAYAKGTTPLPDMDQHAKVTM